MRIKEINPHRIQILYIFIRNFIHKILYPHKIWMQHIVNTSVFAIISIQNMFCESVIM